MELFDAAVPRCDFRFIAGEQWLAEDKKTLEDQGRPAIVFNRALPIIKSVAGIEINSRENTVFLPAIVSDQQQVEANATLNAANNWMSEGCDAESEQSEAFQDSLICGMGWTEQRVDFTEVWNGKYIEDRVYPVEMYWDRDARKANVRDAKRLFRLREMTLRDARDFLKAMKVENVADEDIDASWAAESDANMEAPRPIEERRKREENAAAMDPKDMVRLVHAQWIEIEDYYKVVVPAEDGSPSPQLQDMTTEEHDRLQSMLSVSKMQQLPSLPCRRKVYKQAIIGAKILGEVMPVLSRFGFTWQCITGEKNADKGTWFGLVNSLRDPQRWANKWLSQTMHILNSTAKGGIIAEDDAFEDIREAQLNYARPDAITSVKPGAISKGKLMPKPGAGIPTGYQALLEFAISSIPDVTGINMELLGLRDQNQPGILEKLRKQSAMTILATLFDSLRGFRRMVGRNRLSFIQDFFSDSRLIRIRIKAGVYQGLQITQDKTAGDYEVIVSEAPTSPDQKEVIWACFESLMPVLQPFMMQNPEVALTILEYSPLPSEVVQQLRQIAMTPNPQQQAAQQVDQQKQVAELQDLLSKIALNQARAKETMAKVPLEGAKTQETLAKAQHEHSLAIADLLERARDFHKPIPLTNGSGPGAQAAP